MAPRQPPTNKDEPTGMNYDELWTETERRKYRKKRLKDKKTKNKTNRQTDKRKKIKTMSRTQTDIQRALNEPLPRSFDLLNSTIHDP